MRIQSARTPLPVVATEAGSEVDELDSFVDQAAFEPAALATSVEHLRDNDLAWQRRMELLRGAQHSIVVTSYYVDGDGYGEAYMNELIAAAKRGVDVSLVLDFVASRGALSQKPHDERKKIYALFEALKQAGGTVRYFGEPQDQVKKLGAGIHFKSMVADGQLAIVGGRNIGETYFKEWTDYDVRIEGPIVASVARAQLELLAQTDNSYEETTETRDAFAAQRQRLQSVASDASKTMNREVATKLAKGQSAGEPLHILLSDPIHSHQQNPITNFFVRAAGVAQNEIIASSNYVNPSRELRESLISAARRGAHVLLVTTGKDVGISNIPYFICRSHYKEMMDAGVEIYETPTFEHGKMYVVDDLVAAVGSFNLGKPADASLIEGLVVSEGKDDIANIRDTLLKSVASSQRVEDASIKGVVPRLLALFGRLYDK